MTEKTTVTRYLAYARTATSNDPGEPTSIEAQREAMRLYVAERGGTIVGEYADTEASGVRLDRPGFQGLLAHLSKSDVEAEAVITTNPSRLGRGGTYLVAVSEIESRGGHIETVIGESSTFDNNFFNLTSVVRIMEQYSSAILAEKIIKRTR